MYNVRLIGAVQRILREVRADVVHVHNVHAHLSYYAIRIASQYAPKVFLTAHDVMLVYPDKLVGTCDHITDAGCNGGWNYRVTEWQQLKRFRWRYNPLRNIWIRYCIQKIDRILPVSNALGEALRQNGLKNVSVVHNGLDVSKWKRDDMAVAAFVHKHNLEGKKIIMFIGRASGSKGSDVLLSALRRIAKKEPRVLFLIVGKRDARVEQIEALAEKWDIRDHVACVGWVSGTEHVAALHAAHVLVQLSLYLDPIPTATLEAMAAKKPVVGSCMGGIPEMIVDCVTGYIIDPYNTELLASRIMKLLSNESLADTMGEAGHARVCKEFTLEKQTDAFVALYQI
jgi:glycosyltransferase involved in cell wall biosynthesis